MFLDGEEIAADPLAGRPIGRHLGSLAQKSVRAGRNPTRPARDGALRNDAPQASALGPSTACGVGLSLSTSSIADGARAGSGDASRIAHADRDRQVLPCRLVARVHIY
jgi:hypothetical protein